MTKALNLFSTVCTFVGAWTIGSWTADLLIEIIRRM